MPLPAIYVVRVYRRSRRDRSGVVGVVEEVNDGVRKSFCSAFQLWSVISTIRTSFGRK